MVSGKTRRWSRRRRTVSGGHRNDKLGNKKKVREDHEREIVNVHAGYTPRINSPARSSPIKEIKKKKKNREDRPITRKERRKNKAKDAAGSARAKPGEESCNTRARDPHKREKEK